MASTQFITRAMALDNLRRFGVAMPVLVSLVLLAVSSCAQASSEVKGTIEASRVKGYSSIHELTADSQAVVVAVATSRTLSTSIAGVPDTITFVNVTSTLKGSVAGSEIKIRQLGNASTQTGAEIDPLLQAGTTYVLFLAIFTFGPGQETDQYVVVGGSAGVYIVSGATLNHVRGPDPLPQSLSLGQMKIEVAS